MCLIREKCFVSYMCFFFVDALMRAMCAHVLLNNDKSFVSFHLCNIEGNVDEEK